MIKTIIKSNNPGTFIRNHWLMLLVILQPVLDIFAFWTKNPDATISGYLRLLIMVAFPVVIFLKLKGKDRLRFFLAMAAIGTVCAAHLINTLRVGPVSFVYELSYTAKTAQLPILAVCFVYCIRSEQTRNQAYWGLFFAALIMAVGLGLSVITGTSNVTYGTGLGISGWVIDDNRCANSVIVVTLAAFSVFCSIKLDKAPVNIIVPVLALIILLSNGTKACYFAVYIIFAGFALFMIVERLIKGTPYNKKIVVLLLLLSVFAAVLTPFTPMYKVRYTQQEFADGIQGEVEQQLTALGYDVDRLTEEDILTDPVVKEVYYNYYYKIMWIVSPGLFDRFTPEEILKEFDFTTDSNILINTRRIKTAYTSLLWNRGDSMTKLFGIDISDLWLVGKVDLENDWPAIYYYYGYFGFAAYMGLVLWIVYLVLRRVLINFKTAFTTDNYILLVTFSLLVGLAQFSGSVLRRPNVSIYMALVMGLIYYQAVVKPVSKENDLWKKLN